jgi:hypothetical protein
VIFGFATPFKSIGLDQVESRWGQKAQWLWDAGATGGPVSNFDLPGHFDDIIVEHEIAMKTWGFAPNVQRNRFSSLSPSLLP